MFELRQSDLHDAASVALPATWDRDGAIIKLLLPSDAFWEGD